MMTMYKLLDIIVLCLIHEVASQDAGESCVQDGLPGVCTILAQCRPVLSNPKSKWWKLHRCGFRDLDPIICCVRTAPAVTPAPDATSPGLGATEGDKELPFYDYYSEAGGANATDCAPISKQFTASKTGRKAWDKCIEYQELRFPCERRSDVTGALHRANYCPVQMDSLIIGVGGEAAYKNEFLHMALLGFDPPAPEDLFCGGTIISDRFILTAGHCTSAKNFTVSTAKVGFLNRTEDVPASRIYRIKRIIKHPDYNPPSKYNDIALLETETPIKLDHTVVPACLDTGETPGSPRALATGWGNTAYLGEKSDVLIKVPLMKFPSEECSRRYRPSHKYLRRGYDEDLQLCYGDHTEARDTCQGDSGGPLQILNRHVFCMHTVVGVTSYGRGCGSVGLPGIYTRVAAFTPWIESVVWP